MTASLRYGENVYGVLSASVPIRLITDEEKDLFAEVVADIAFGLHNMDIEREREQAEEEILKMNEELEKRIAEQELAEENVRMYADLATKAQEEERKRIALDLHDETAQELSRLGLEIDLLMGRTNSISADAINGLEELRGRTDHILQGVRRFSQDLRPPLLEDFGLEAAISGLVDDLCDQYAINCSLETAGTSRRFSPSSELVLFRIAQEALSNVGKHSRATEATIQLRFGPEKTTLSVTDNGQGFEVPKGPGGFARLGRLGILGMHERARLIHGSCSIESEPGRGTTVTVEFRG